MQIADRTVCDPCARHTNLSLHQWWFWLSACYLLLGKCWDESGQVLGIRGWSKGILCDFLIFYDAWTFCLFCVLASYKFWMYLPVGKSSTMAWSFYWTDWTALQDVLISCVSCDLDFRALNALSSCHPDMFAFGSSLSPYSKHVKATKHRRVSRHFLKQVHIGSDFSMFILDSRKDTPHGFEPGPRGHWIMSRCFGNVSGMPAEAARGSTVNWLSLNHEMLRISRIWRQTDQRRTTCLHVSHALMSASVVAICPHSWSSVQWRKMRM